MSVTRRMSLSLVPMQRCHYIKLERREKEKKKKTAVDYTWDQIYWTSYLSKSWPAHCRKAISNPSLSSCPPRNPLPQIPHHLPTRLVPARPRGACNLLLIAAAGEIRCRPPYPHSGSWFHVVRRQFDRSISRFSGREIFVRSGV